jgi:hypothetical protein
MEWQNKENLVGLIRGWSLISQDDEDNFEVTDSGIIVQQFELTSHVGYEGFQILEGSICNHFSSPQRYRWLFAWP